MNNGDISTNPKTCNYLYEIIIPTNNRHGYFDRIIKYYKHFKCFVKIIDASKEKYLSTEFPPNVQYFHLPDYEIYERVNFVLNQSTAKYIMFVADDDIVFEPAILKGLSYLEKNNEFSLVQGKWSRFNRLSFIDDDIVFEPPIYNEIPYFEKSREFSRVQDEGWGYDFSIFQEQWLEIFAGEKNDMSQIDARNSQDCLEDDAASRCSRYLSKYFMTFWAIYRKDIFLKVCNILAELDLYYYRMSEIIHSALTCYFGKIKFINCVLGARENIPNGRKNNHDPRYSFKNILTKANTYEVFGQEFQKMTDRLDGRVCKGFTKLVSDGYNDFSNNRYRTAQHRNKV